MILTEKRQDVIVVGEDTSKKAGISQNKMAKLQYLLTKGLYKDPITAVVAEWTNNGIDSVVQAGKNPIDNPVIVSFYTKDNKYFLSVEDKGIGLDAETFEGICMEYLESTKEDDNETIGHFGIGMKSFLSLERSANFTCRRDGIERKYIVYEGEEFVKYDLIFEGHTSEENGVIAELQIKDWNERSQFITKARKKLAYYDTAVILIDGVPQPSVINRHELFQWSSEANDANIHIALKDVYYPIDYEALGIAPIGIPIALRIDLKDGLTPTPSRESYITNEHTKALILRKLKEVGNWLFTKYNDSVKDIDNFYDAYPFLNQHIYNVTIGTKTFTVNPIIPYCKVSPKDPSVKGITLKPAGFYKTMIGAVLKEYCLCAYFTQGKQKTTRFYQSLESLLFNSQPTQQIVLVKDTPIGNLKEYLQTLYPNGTWFARRLFFRDLKKPLGTFTDDYSYETLLGLKNYPKDQWQAHVDEFNFVRDSLISTLADERGIDQSTGFEQFLADKKEALRLDRLANPQKYKQLNKLKGQVTFHHFRIHNSKSYFSDKRTYNVPDLVKNHFLTVYCREDQKDLALDLAWYMQDTKVEFVMVGKLETKKIPDHYNFIKLEQFMKDSQPFRRLASALLFQDVIKDYDSIGTKHKLVFDSCLKNLSKKMETLRKYVNDNLHANNDSDQTKDYILQMAKAQNLFDQSIWDIYLECKQAVKKYDFITLFDVSHYWNSEKIAKVDRTINQILLFRKKYYNDIPEVIVRTLDEDKLQKAI